MLPLQQYKQTLFSKSWLSLCAEEVDKMTKKMQEVEECDVPVVAEDFLVDAAKGAALLKIPSHTISSWGAPRHSLPTDEPDYGKSFKSKGNDNAVFCLENQSKWGRHEVL